MSTRIFDHYDWANSIVTISVPLIDTEGKEMWHEAFEANINPDTGDPRFGNLYFNEADRPTVIAICRLVGLLNGKE